MKKQLEGKTAVITGGTSGIGLATAKRLSLEGAKVYVTGRNQSNLDAAVKDIGNGAVGMRADSALLPDIDLMFKQLKEEVSGVDVLVLNAGVFKPAPISALTPEAYATMFDINVRGMVFTFQKSLPLLSKGASVILVGSIGGHIGMPGMSIYSATKAATRALARTWMLELKDRGIRVNVLSPGHTATPGTDVMFSAIPAAAKEQLISMIPLGRLGKPEEIANAALFLASSESSYMNGAELTIDGGVSQY